MYLTIFCRELFAKSWNRIVRKLKWLLLGTLTAVCLVFEAHDLFRSNFAKMSKRPWSNSNGELGPPRRWMHCPRKGKVVSGLFLPFKTPLSSRYDDMVPESNRFYPSMVLEGGEPGEKEVGLWIDLTNTTRFYNKKEVENAGVEYVKLNCKGFGECPSEAQVQEFISICKSFAKRSDKIVAVHCTHGFNRTGFLIASYLVIENNCSIDAAIAAFVSARPPGIYKQEYLQELFRRFDDVAFTPEAPLLPNWCLDEPDEDETDAEAPSKKRAEVSEGASFADGCIPDVELVTDRDTVNYVHKTCKEYCNYGKKDFPGSQPVSLDRDNIELLRLHPYMVSWKADGIRYLMFMDGKQRTFLIDRDNNVFLAPTLTFLLPDGDTHLTKTLVDGELVFDTVNGQRTPRYLIYDVVAYCDDLVREQPFHERHRIIRKRIIDPRIAALGRHRIIREREPFGVRQKPFFELCSIEKVFSLDVGHETDGVVFQRVDEPYMGGRCPTVLKWKPSCLNSVDFLLQIRKEKREGMISEYVGNLMVLGVDVPFDRMPITKDLWKYNNKIIECSVTNGRWTFMRERTDKSVPNSYETALGVRKSIRFPIMKADLVKFIMENSLKYQLTPGSFVRLEHASLAPDHH
uniref:mRNA-capping enzyme n=2 Tax=Trichuris muris TaxID=70415 RepID=A0A5S6QUV6_TRIMR